MRLPVGGRYAPFGTPPTGLCPPPPDATPSGLTAVLSFDGTGKPVIWPAFGFLLSQLYPFFLPKRLRAPLPLRAMSTVALVFWCCCASVALASASFLAAFFVGALTSGARSPSKPLGVAEPGVPVGVEPVRLPSPRRLPFAVRRARLARRVSSAMRSAWERLRRVWAVTLGKMMGGRGDLL